MEKGKPKTREHSPPTYIDPRDAAAIAGDFRRVLEDFDAAAKSIMGAGEFAGVCRSRENPHADNQAAQPLQRAKAGRLSAFLRGVASIGKGFALVWEHFLTDLHQKFR